MNIQTDTIEKALNFRTVREFVDNSVKEAMRENINRLEREMIEIRIEADTMRQHHKNAEAVIIEITRERDELKRDLKAAQCNRDEWRAIAEDRKIKQA